MPDLPNTTTMGLTEARAQLSTLVNDAFRTKRRVIVEKNGIPVAAIVSVEDLARLVEYDRQKFGEFLESARAAFADVPDEELMREGLRAAREARIRLYNERQATVYDATVDTPLAVREEP